MHNADTQNQSHLSASSKRENAIQPFFCDDGVNSSSTVQNPTTRESFWSLTSKHRHGLHNQHKNQSPHSSLTAKHFSLRNSFHISLSDNLSRPPLMQWPTKTFVRCQYSCLPGSHCAYKSLWYHQSNCLCTPLF